MHTLQWLIKTLMQLFIDLNVDSQPKAKERELMVGVLTGLNQHATGGTERPGKLVSTRAHSHGSSSGMATH